MSLKKVGRPALKRDVVKYIVSHYDLNLRRACALIRQTRSTQYYRSVKDLKAALRQRMHEIVRTRVRYGYRRIHVLLKREGWQLGRNQAFHLYQEDLWAYHHQIQIDFSRPGKPTDNGHVESFNGSFRDECLNLHWFGTLEETKAIIKAWRQDYNESRPHMTLNGQSPAEFAHVAGLAGRQHGLMKAEN